MQHLTQSTDCNRQLFVFPTGLLNKSSDFVLTNVEGHNVESSCRDAVSRSGMFFCRGTCKKQEDILIETDQDKAQNGRYGIEYKNGSSFGQYVTIAKVVKSDSGQYTCGYGRALSPDSSYTFLLLVDGEFVFFFHLTP